MLWILIAPALLVLVGIAALVLLGVLASEMEKADRRDNE